jgi:hypothetical protein
MGSIKLWTLTKDPTDPTRWRSTLQRELDHHRTRINEMYLGSGVLWTGMSIYLFRDSHLKMRL